MLGCVVNTFFFRAPLIVVKGVRDLCRPIPHHHNLGKSQTSQPLRLRTKTITAALQKGDSEVDMSLGGFQFEVVGKVQQHQALHLEGK